MSWCGQGVGGRRGLATEGGARCEAEKGWQEVGGVGSSAQSSEMTSRGDGGSEREVQEGRDLHVHVANSCCCTTETNTIL